jgi:hypothetical protein
MTGGSVTSAAMLWNVWLLFLRLLLLDHPREDQSR